jgi:hypothetical protein
MRSYQTSITTCKGVASKSSTDVRARMKTMINRCSGGGKGGTLVYRRGLFPVRVACVGGVVKESLFTQIREVRGGWLSAVPRVCTKRVWGRGLWLAVEERGRAICT